MLQLLNTVQHWFQYGLMYASLVTLGIVLMAWFVMATYKSAYPCRGEIRKWVRSPLLVLFTIGMVYYGATKPRQADYKNVGSQSSIQMKSIDVSYNTNTFHTVISICWTNDFSAVNPGLDLWFREADSNDWTRLMAIPNNAVKTIDEEDATLKYIEWELTSTTNDYSTIPKWWLGDDRPGIIITVVGIEVLDFQHHSENVHIEWECEDARATSFTIKTRSMSAGVWTDVTNTTEKVIDLPGFWYNYDRYFMIESEFEDTSGSGGGGE